MNMGQILLLCIKSAGMIVTTPRSDGQSPLAWTLRKRMHQHMSGRELKDHGKTIQLGTSEDLAVIVDLFDLFQKAKVHQHGPLEEEVHNRMQQQDCWVCGPKALWIATGTTLQFFHATRILGSRLNGR